MNEAPKNRQPSACAPQTVPTEVPSNLETFLTAKRRLRPWSSRFRTIQRQHTDLRHKQPTRRAVRTVGALLVVLVISLSPPSAVAQLDPGVTPFGVSLGGQRYANGSHHSYRTTETNIVERYRWEHRFDGAGGQDVYNQTDINLARARYTIVTPDFYWNVKPLSGATAGTYTCTVPLSNFLCSTGRIVIGDDSHNLSELHQNNLVCHEIGHSIGFGHGTAGNSCMSNGENNQLNTIEIGLINNHY